MEPAAPLPLAWVESPLQLIAAAEWAATRGPVDVALRLTGPQMPKTAEELLARGANFASVAPYYGIPWMLLAGHREWAVGDGFSGQFRLASSILRPAHLTLFDDGAMTTALGDAVLGATPYTRPHVHESGLATVLGVRARERMLTLASRGRVELMTAFVLGEQRLSRMAELGILVRPHRFAWTRQTARPIDVPGDRVLLGSALPVDRRMSLDSYLRWVRAEVGTGALAYLPHRRETPEMLLEVAKIPGVRVYQMGLPIELVLAGAQAPLDIVCLPTSAQTTLEYVLEGTGSVIRTRSLAAVE